MVLWIDFVFRLIIQYEDYQYNRAFKNMVHRISQEAHNATQLLQKEYAAVIASSARGTLRTTPERPEFTSALFA